jgi:hypothetical protein
MNSPFMAAQARALSERIAKEAIPAEQIRKAYSLALQRAPNEAELALGQRFLSAQSAPTEAPSSVPAAPKDKKNAAPGPTRLDRFAQALLASNELFYVD